MASVEHDRTTGLLALGTDAGVCLLDRHDLAVAGAVHIRLAAAGHTLTPELVWAAITPHERPLMIVC
jgi:hypothetical protein